MSYGAYGVVVQGLGDDALQAGLMPLPNSAPEVSVRWARSEQEENLPTLRIGESIAVFPLLGGGWLDVDRRSKRATFHVEREPTLSDLVHPFLAPVGATFARWAGWESFHCMAPMVDDEVWLVVGGKGAGKSTLAAALAQQGVGIFTDDLLVVEPGSPPIAHAGPRSLDLRHPAVEALGLEALVEPVRGRARARLRLDDVPATAPVAGVVYIDPGHVAELVPIAPSARLARLAAHRPIRSIPADPSQLLDMVQLPTLGLRRPKDWSELERVSSVLMSGLAR